MFPYLLYQTGADVPAVGGQAGLNSMLAPWIGGAGADIAPPPTIGYFSLLGLWIGGAGGDTVIPPLPPVIIPTSLQTSTSAAEAGPGGAGRPRKTKEEIKREIELERQRIKVYIAKSIGEHKEVWITPIETVIELDSVENGIEDDIEDGIEEIKFSIDIRTKIDLSEFTSDTVRLTLFDFVEKKQKLQTKNKKVKEKYKTIEIISEDDIEETIEELLSEIYDPKIILFEQKREKIRQRIELERQKQEEMEECMLMILAHMVDD